MEKIQEALNSIWKGWTVKEQLGSGAFGSVYRIERQEYGITSVSALKVITIPSAPSEVYELKQDGMDEESIRSYLGGVVKDIVNEAAVMLKLRGNSNIVSYEDHAVIEHEESIGWDIYIRMEILTPIFEYFKRNRPKVTDIIQLGIDMCNALEACQKYNIVHRDIKPQNIFVSQFGDFKLGDFGIARKIERTGTSLSMKGTKTYMAPEVYMGDKYDKSVDLYSLGIVLYRFLNNNRTPFLPPFPEPFSAQEAEEANIRRFRGEKIPKPCNAEGKLADVILKACSFHPKDRYNSPVSMREDLEGARDDLINPQSYPEEKSSKPFKGMVVIVFLIGLGVFGAFGGYRYYQKSLERTVPALTNMALDAAQNKAAGDDESLLVVKGGEEYSNTVEKGNIISQDIEPGTIVKKGDEINVIVSKGGLSEVPGLIGKKQADAKKILAKANLNYEVSEKAYSDDVAKGSIISQEPAAGATIEENETVSVVISDGIEQVEVPKLVGKTIEQAKAALKKAKLKFDSSSKEYSDEIDKGKVIRQSVTSGKQINKNTKVSLVVSDGPEPDPEPEYKESVSKGNTGTTGKKNNNHSKTGNKNPGYSFNDYSD